MEGFLGKPAAQAQSLMCVHGKVKVEKETHEISHKGEEVTSILCGTECVGGEKLANWREALRDSLCFF